MTFLTLDQTQKEKKIVLGVLIISGVCFTYAQGFRPRPRRYDSITNSHVSMSMRPEMGLSIRDEGLTTQVTLITTQCCGGGWTCMPALGFYARAHGTQDVISEMNAEVRSVERTFR